MTRVVSQGLAGFDQLSEELGQLARALLGLVGVVLEPEGRSGESEDSRTGLGVSLDDLLVPGGAGAVGFVDDHEGKVLAELGFEHWVLAATDERDHSPRSRDQDRGVVEGRR